ncbi:MAG: type IV pilin protein [Methylotenera sp.]
MNRMNSQYSGLHHYATQKQSGLTIIELMIVVAIIGVLASIALPAYNDYKEKARINQAVSDISNIASQIEAYWQDARAYPPSLADIGAAAMTDPWGNAYRYTDLSLPGSTGAARKDRNLVPLNSDFDLYSMGKNGQTTGPISTPKGRDDIIRANDGRFIDIASKY